MSIIATRFIFLGLIFTSTNSFASFNLTSDRSINSTGETLKAGQAEVGFASLSYGMNDVLMLSVPTLPLVFGYYGAELRLKGEITDTMRLSPEVGVGVSDGKVSPAAGLSFGIDSASRKHSFTLSASLSKKKRIDIDRSVRKPDLILTKETFWTVSPSINYDYYTDSGNLFFAGFKGPLPYLGFTWAWENVHAGIGAFTIIPFPFIYWRF